MPVETAKHLPSYQLEDAFEANELFQRNGWTDGLPIIPPTPERVAEFLEAAGLEPEDVIGTEAVRQRHISAAKVAINGVMAGCVPSYWRTLVATVQALCQPEYSLHCAFSSTGGSAAFIIVNRAGRTQLGMEGLHSVFGSGKHATDSNG